MEMAGLYIPLFFKAWVSTAMPLKPGRFSWVETFLENPNRHNKPIFLFMNWKVFLDIAGLLIPRGVWQEGEESGVLH